MLIWYTSSLEREKYDIHSFKRCRFGGSLRSIDFPDGREFMIESMGKIPRYMEISNSAMVFIFKDRVIVIAKM